MHDRLQFAGELPTLRAMIARPSLLRLLAATTLAGIATAQMPLAEVAKLARQRAEKSRPTQQQALEPFLKDLKYDYKDNRQFLEPKIKEVADLGESVVPLLLEKLSPAQGNADARNLAGNCRRVLERMDPSSFVDALAELANGTNEIGRTEAIQLLGVAQSPRAIELLADLLDRTTGEDLRLVVRSLRLLKATSAAPKVVTMLGSNDRQMREAVLAYLIAVKPAQVADTVVQALSSERDAQLLPSYIEYFAVAVREHEAATRALLPLLNDERLLWQDKRRLVQALATVAPKDHDKTRELLHAIIDNQDTTALAVDAAVSLRTIGDNRGITKLKNVLNEQIRKNKKIAALYEQRANLAMATEEWGDAVTDFENMLEVSDGHQMTRRAWTGIMRCEARRKKTTQLTNAMKTSTFTVEEIEAIGGWDPVFHETLQQDKVRAFLQKLAKDQPKGG